MTDTDELDVDRLARRTAPGFDRRVVELGPFAELAYDPASWQDAIVFVRSGAIEIECADGERGRFGRDDVLCLACLSIECVRNTAAEPARLLVVSRGRERRAG